ncbi:735_t:CDS:2, partial [Diversispora eburnea]
NRWRNGGSEVGVIGIGGLDKICISSNRNSESLTGVEGKLQKEMNLPKEFDTNLKNKKLTNKIKEQAVSAQKAKHKKQAVRSSLAQ